MSLEIEKLMHIFNKMLNRDVGIPEAEDVFKNRNVYELVEFFNKTKTNYYIVLYDGSILSSFEYEKPGVMRVNTEKGGAPYLCLYHNTLEHLFIEQEQLSIGSL